MNTSPIDIDNITISFTSPPELQKTLLKKLKSKKQKTFEVDLKEKIEDLKGMNFKGKLEIDGRYFEFMESIF